MAPESIVRIARSERSRPSQAMRGSACKLLRPAGCTVPEIADTALDFLAKQNLPAHPTA